MIQEHLIGKVMKMNTVFKNIDMCVKLNSNMKISCCCLFLFFLMNLFYSCKQGEIGTVDTIGALVKVNIVSENNKGGNLLSNSKETYVNSNKKVVNIGNVPFTAGSKMEVTMINNTSSATYQKLGSTNLVANNNEPFTSVEQIPLTKDVKYHLLVYNSSGALVIEKTYSYGNEASEPGIPLDAGQTYTFIAFSINSTLNLPALSNKGSLSTASLDAVNADLMYFKNVVTLKDGVNNLNVVLKHQFSEITTLLTMDPNTTGFITSILSPVITPTYGSANLKLQTDALAYNGLNNAGLPVVFSSLGLGQRSVTSTPTILIHPKEDNGCLTFGSITIDEETKNNFTVGSLKITPGHKYNLNLVFRTCTRDVVGATDLNWDYPEVIRNNTKGIVKDGIFYPNGSTITKTIEAPGADYGFVFDIFEFDNAFNMEVNDVKLATKEIQFQLVNGSSQENIRFADGSMYEGINTEGGANIPAVYNMIGTASRPLIKVVISRKGEVTMYGSKRSGGPLYPLELMNGNTFNIFPWNGGAVGENTVKVTQLVDGLTIIKGFGSGKKKVPCS